MDTHTGEILVKHGVIRQLYSSMCGFLYLQKKSTWKGDRVCTVAGRRLLYWTSYASSMRLYGNPCTCAGSCCPMIGSRPTEPPIHSTCLSLANPALFTFSTRSFVRIARSYIYELHPLMTRFLPSSRTCVPSTLDAGCRSLRNTSSHNVSQRPQHRRRSDRRPSRSPPSTLPELPDEADRTDIELS